MLEIVIGEEGFNDSTNQFELINPIRIQLEHSLAAMSKWESNYQKPFLSSTEKTVEEILYYLKTMIVTPNIDPDCLSNCSEENLDIIQRYIDSSQSATTFSEMSKQRGSGETITSELIYYWMVAFNIPFECQYWHLNRLFSLIRICNIKNSKPQKMSRSEMASRNAALNAKRKEQLKTSG